MLKIENEKQRRIQELQNRRNRKDQHFIFNQANLKEITCENAKLKHEHVHEMKMKQKLFASKKWQFFKEIKEKML